MVLKMNVYLQMFALLSFRVFVLKGSWHGVPKQREHHAKLQTSHHG